MRDASELFAAQRWTGSIYLAGYGVECLAKAEVARELRRLGGWLRHQDSPLYSALWTHDLLLLAEVLAFPPLLMKDVRVMSRTWNVGLRYMSAPHDRQGATEILRLSDDIGRQIRGRLAA
jgi:hypothetical protein